jgi:diaminopimelate epimerase
MQLHFSKYHGTGNDFILIDNRQLPIQNIPVENIRHLCHRRFGIGADGLILLQNKEGYDFEMIYFNSDGNLSSMCGNGGRCIVAFARKLGIISNHAKFIAVDGDHTAEIISYNIKSNEAEVSLEMADVKEIEKGDGFYFLNTGSPHYVTLVENVEYLNVDAEGKKIRNSPRFIKEGTNVNFVQRENDLLHVRTYERGVEEETWSCGTGVTAAALVAGLQDENKNSVKLKTPGGPLQVLFERDGNGFKNIFLQGAATHVYDGMIQL